VFKNKIDFEEKTINKIAENVKAAERFYNQRHIAGKQGNSTRMSAKSHRVQTLECPSTASVSASEL
jgi:hypothetical protein